MRFRNEKRESGINIALSITEANTLIQNPAGRGYFFNFGTASETVIIGILDFLPAMTILDHTRSMFSGFYKFALQ